MNTYTLVHKNDGKETIRHGYTLESAKRGLEEPHMWKQKTDIVPPDSSQDLGASSVVTEQNL